MAGLGEAVADGEADAAGEAEGGAAGSSVVLPVSAGRLVAGTAEASAVTAGTPSAA